MTFVLLWPLVELKCVHFILNADKARRVSFTTIIHPAETNEILPLFWQISYNQMCDGSCGTCIVAKQLGSFKWHLIPLAQIGVTVCRQPPC
jgi:hypothetical protein